MGHVMGHYLIQIGNSAVIFSNKLIFISFNSVRDGTPIPNYRLNFVYEMRMQKFRKVPNDWFTDLISSLLC